MDQTQQLLQCVVENSRMGLDAIEQLLGKTNDQNFRNELMYQQEQYQALRRDAEQQLSMTGVKPEPKGMTARAGMWMGMQMSTITDRTNPHLADLIIRGATMGVIELTKARNEFDNASAEAQGIASNFISQQQDTIERMKSFLV